MPRVPSSKGLANPSVWVVALAAATLMVAILILGRRSQPAVTQSAPVATPQTARDLAETGADRLEAQGPAVDAFKTRAKEYAALQRRLEAALPALEPTEEPGRIKAHEKLLAERLREARPDVKAGDVFGEAAPVIRAIIAQDAKDRAVADAYALMQDVPVQGPPAVNGEYPEEVPLSTMPALILLRLPRVPEGLEYRFMGRDLILRDSKANLVVDVVRDAVPTVQR